MTDPEPQALRAVPVAARLAGIDPSDVLDLLRTGRIAGFRIGDALHVDLFELTELTGRQPSPATASPPPGWIHVSVTPAMLDAATAAATTRNLPTGTWASAVVGAALRHAPRSPVGAHRWTTRGAAQIYTATLCIAVQWDPQHLAEAAYHERQSSAEWIRRRLLEAMPAAVTADVAERTRLARAAPPTGRPRRFAAQLTTPMAEAARAQVAESARQRGLSISSFAREVWTAAAALPDHGTSRIADVDDTKARGAIGVIGLVEPHRRDELLRTVRHDAGMVWAVWARAQLVVAAANGSPWV